MIAVTNAIVLFLLFFTATCILDQFIDPEE